jgi:hypothetical protein
MLSRISLRAQPAAVGRYTPRRATCERQHSERRGLQPLQAGQARQAIGQRAVQEVVAHVSAAAANAEQQRKRASADKVSNSVSSQAHPCVALVRLCACVRVCVTEGSRRGRAHLVDLVSAPKATDERRQRPKQLQASGLDGAWTAGAVAMCRAAPRPRAAGLLRHGNRLDPFGCRYRRRHSGRRSGRRRGRPCEVYGPCVLIGHSVAGVWNTHGAHTAVR